MVPPDDGDESAEDSGDEDCVDINRLSGRQLRVQARAKITHQRKTFQLGEESSDDEQLEEL